MSGGWNTIESDAVSLRLLNDIATSPIQLGQYTRVVLMLCRVSSHTY